MAPASRDSSPGSRVSRRSASPFSTACRSACRRRSGARAQRTWAASAASSSRASPSRESPSRRVKPASSASSASRLSATPTCSGASRGVPLRLIERDIRLAPLEAPLHVGVALSREALDAELAGFTRLLGLSLLGLALLLLVALAAQVRWALAPLRRLQADLHAVENGDAERLDTRLPGELSRLAGAINAVLARDRRLMERARHAAGNLAHALKTPVSVLYTQADGLEEPQRQRMQAELRRIDEAVRHHLARASAAGEAGLHRPSRCLEVLAPVLEGLGRLAERRGIRLNHSLPEAMTLRMDPQDLQELVGNLLENALRWADSRVILAGRSEAGGSWLEVEDDGPGMSEAQRRQAMARGARLDEVRSGSGLGLAIVADLVALHGGSLSLDRSRLGGLAVRVWLPTRPLTEAGPPDRQDG